METGEISVNAGLIAEEEVSVGAAEKGVVGIIIIFGGGTGGRAGFFWS